LKYPGLPDGLFANQKTQIGLILEGLGMENVFLCCGHLKCFMAIGYNLLQMVLWSFGMFFPFW
jgi:hypothetical protein